jgi:hypothetical protein
MGQVGRLLAIGTLGGALTLLALRGCASGPSPRTKSSARAPALTARNVTYTLHPGIESRISASTVFGELEPALTLSLVVDGSTRSLTIDKASVRLEDDTLSASVSFDLDGHRAVASLVLRTEPAADALVLSLSAPISPHRLELEMVVHTREGAAFVSGVGALSDFGTVSGRHLMVEEDAYVLGVTSAGAPLTVTSLPNDEHDEGAPLRLAVTRRSDPPDAPARPAADLRVVVSSSSQRVWGALHLLSGEVATRVKGRVTGTGGGARVYGLDADGVPRIAIAADPNGGFTVDVPKTIVEWYAALDTSRTSAPVHFTPGTPWELRLDVSPGGELAVRIVDPDTQRPVTARLLVHGIDGTIDPSFGPDYRASGAGPLMDALRGEISTPLPAGRYRIAATKGLEWSVDATTVDITPGHRTTIELSPRHVVPTPGVVGADLHVHARPSFDAPVSPEDRVLSLVAAGIEFAVPTEHNIVGDYASMLATLDLTRDLASVPGVEVTTYSPRFGHFGVFPYRGPVPSYRGTNPSALFQSVRRADNASLLQVNHPRLPMSIGYFSVFHYQPQTGKPPPGMRMDFDTLEVFNGYDLAKNERVEALLRDWFALLDQGYRFVATGDSDSHRIQYQWAGYPRTLIAAGAGASGDEGPLDSTAILAALKKGHATVTNGPVVELEVAGGHPGDDMTTLDDPVQVHAVVRAAPWVDVTSLEIVAGGRSVDVFAVPSRPTKLGPEPGTLDEASRRTVRFDREFTIGLGSGNTWVVAVARGTRKLDDVLPFMPTTPLAFTNPVWVTRDPDKRVRK